MQFQSFDSFRSQNFDSAVAAVAAPQPRSVIAMTPAAPQNRGIARGGNVLGRSAAATPATDNNNTIDDLATTNAYERLLALDEHNVKRGIPKMQQGGVMKSVVCRKEGVACIICTETIAINKHCALLPKCKHSDFHQHCLAEWLERSPTCPICRAEVK